MDETVQQRPAGKGTAGKRKSGEDAEGKADNGGGDGNPQAESNGRPFCRCQRSEHGIAGKSGGPKTEAGEVACLFRIISNLACESICYEQC